MRAAETPNPGDTRAEPVPSWGFENAPNAQSSTEGHAHGRPRPSAPAFSAEDSFPLNRLPGGCATQAETQEARKGQRDAEQTHGPTENTPATRPLRERKCLRVHRASGLHFPEFVRSAFLSGSASDYTECLDYISQNAEENNPESHFPGRLREAS